MSHDNKGFDGNQVVLNPMSMLAQMETGMRNRQFVHPDDEKDKKNKFDIESSSSSSEDEDSQETTSSSQSNGHGTHKERPEMVEEGLEKFNKPCYITVEDSNGDIQKLKIDMQDDTFTLSPQSNERRGSIMPFVENFIRKRSITEPEPQQIRPDLLEELQKKSKKRRLVAKGGHCNVNLRNVPKKRMAYFKDVFTTAIDMQWRFTILSFALSFIVTWLFFALIYYIIAYAYGDLEVENLPGGANRENGTHEPCFTAVYGFTSIYLMSLETQHTIGYGTRSVNENCIEAIVVLSLQSIVGVLLSSIMAGIVFAKLARPKGRSYTIVFSKNAVVSMRNGQLFLIFRLSNIRKSHLIEAHVKVTIVWPKKTTDEGEHYTYSQQDLKVTTVEGDDKEGTLMILPTTVYHKIDEDSPFYGLGPKDIMDAKFEMVVALEGIVEPTGNSMQARTSYLPREILWGFKFCNMVNYSSHQGTYMVDVSYLNAVVEDETPSLSMRDVDDQRRRPSVHFDVAPTDDEADKKNIANNDDVKELREASRNTARFIMSKVRDKIMEPKLAQINEVPDSNDKED